MVILPHKAVLKISGPDRENFLQGLLTNNVQHVSGQALLYALLLNPQGKILYDFFVLACSDYYLLDMPEQYAEELTAKLLLYKLRSDVEIEPVHELSVAISLLQSGTHFYPDPRNADLCYRGFIQADIASAQHDKLLPEYHRKRMALKIPELGIDFAPLKYFPLELGMNQLQALDYQKGCYVGQEVTARSTYRGTIRKGIYLLELDSDNAEQLSGAEIFVDGAKIGSLMHPYGGKALALLYTEKAKICIAKQQKLTIYSASAMIRC